MTLSPTIPQSKIPGLLIDVAEAPIDSTSLLPEAPPPAASPPDPLPKQAPLPSEIPKVPAPLPRESPQRRTEDPTGPNATRPNAEIPGFEEGRWTYHRNGRRSRQPPMHLSEYTAPKDRELYKIPVEIPKECTPQ